MIKAIATALVLSLTVSSSAKAADLGDLIAGIVGGIILHEVVKGLTKDENLGNSTHNDNMNLFNAVKRVVPIYEDTNREYCKYSNNSKHYGYYNSQENFIMICAGLTYNEWHETVRHETAHLIQDCMMGLNNNNMTTHFTRDAVQSQITARTTEWLKSYRNASVDVQWLEAEAFTMEVWNANEVRKVLNNRCK